MVLQRRRADFSRKSPFLVSCSLKLRNKIYTTSCRITRRTRCNLEKDRAMKGCEVIAVFCAQVQ